MRYWKAGMLMDVVGHKGTPVEMPPDRLEEQNALALTCWLNEAMCYIRMAQNEHETGRNCRGGLVDSATNPTLWRKAIASCDVALKYDEGNVKGAPRRRARPRTAAHPFVLPYQAPHAADSLTPASTAQDITARGWRIIICTSLTRQGSTTRGRSVATRAPARFVRLSMS